MLMLLAVALLTACSSDIDEQKTKSEKSVQEVTLTFSPYQVEQMTRAATSIAGIVTHLDVWLYESGSEAVAVHQSADDVQFGSISLTLDKTKTYTLYAVGHKAVGPATLADGIITFPDDKTTHSMYFTTTFSPATITSLSCLMNRIVADFRLEITDEIPTSAVKFRFTVSGVYDRWSVTTGATHGIDRVSTINYGGTSAIFNVYAITTDAQTTHDIIVEALDENDGVVQSRTFADVPLRNGYKTNYRGTFFIDTPMSMSFTVNDWNEYDTVDF